MSKKQVLIIISILLLLFVACGDDDDDDDNPFNGAKYTINANIITGAASQEAGTNQVEIIRNDPDAIPANEGVCRINGESLVLDPDSDNDADVAYFDASAIEIPTDESSEFSFVTEEDSFAIITGTPATAEYEIDIPVPPGPTYINNGDDIEIAWHIESGTAENTRIAARWFHGDSLVTYLADIPFSETSYTIPGSATEGAGQVVSTMFVMITATENHHEVDETDYNGDFYCGGQFDVTHFEFNLVDPSEYTCSVTDGVISWTPADYAMTVSVRRISGADPAAIWSLMWDGSGTSISPPITYGVTPADAMLTWGPDEVLQSGSTYVVDVMIPDFEGGGGFVSDTFTH